MRISFFRCSIPLFLLFAFVFWGNAAKTAPPVETKNEQQLYERERLPNSELERVQQQFSTGRYSNLHKKLVTFSTPGSPVNDPWLSCSAGSLTDWSDPLIKHSLYLLYPFHYFW